MNILYVSIVIAFAITLISSFENLILNNVKIKKAAENSVSDFYVMRELAQITMKSLDAGRVYPTTTQCPSGTRRITASGLTAPGSKACWPNGPGNCFEIGTDHYLNLAGNRRICIVDDLLVTHNLLNLNKFNNIASVILVNSIHQAQAAVPSNINTNTSNHGNYTGMNLYGPQVGATSSSKGNVRVELPVPGASQSTAVNSNFINCAGTGPSHTTCITITFCVDGTPGCPNSARLQQTFAVRSF